MQQGAGGSVTTPNSAVDRTAGSHSLAAASHRERYANARPQNHGEYMEWVADPVVVERRFIVVEGVSKQWW